MAENLCTGHELIIKAYDEVGGELLYSGGFITEPNDTVEDFLLENNIILSNAATAEVECDMTGDMWEIEETYFPSRETMTFYNILSQLETWRMCDPNGTWTEDGVEGNMTEIPATVEMRIYGAFKKENNQHGAIFTWHSVRDEDYSAMRGPCPEGFHVPYNTEFTTLYNILDNIGALTEGREGTDFRNYLKIPSSFRYINNNGNYVDAATTFGCNAKSTSSFATTGLQIDARTVRQNVSLYKSYGTFIRPFKDTPVAPDNNRTVLYDGSSTATGAGVFWNNTLGLISVSGDGNTRYTISDKNLGATRVYNTGDTESESNCGGYFQYGNNHMFPFNGTITTSSTQVDTTGYGPENPYSSSTFIIRASSPYDWSSITNNNLRGGVTGVQSGYKLLHKEFYLDYSAMRGPCPEGFHIPLNTEWVNVKDIWDTLSGSTTDGVGFSTYLKLPKCGWRQYSNGAANSADGYYRCCDQSTTSSEQYYALHFYDSSIYRDIRYTTYGFGIRPFYDKSVAPDSSWTKLYDGSSTATGAGIFHNATLGLISISVDGTNWYTIADKNCGATVVWNYGDTKSANNVGKLYQRGNNYGFPYTGTLESTSSTQVDASTYGPGNYYESSTFILGGNLSTPYNWSSSNNPNLRGGVTGAVEGGRRVI